MNAGLCPHGLPFGACPICNGSAGMVRSSDKNRSIGEMTYHECLVMGAMMKAQKQKQENYKLNVQNWSEKLAKFEKSIETTIENMKNFIKLLPNNFISFPISFTINNVVVPIMTLVKNVVGLGIKLQEKLSQIKEKLIDIQDKLNAIFGEAKAFIDKKISEFVSALKSKLDAIFKKIFNKNSVKDDDKKIEEDKKIFNLKTMIQKIFKKKKKNK